MDRQKNGKPRHHSEDLTYLRKIKKPLVEKKRRERINTSLYQLKQLLLENIKMNGGTQVSKLDKADILELTVSYLRHIQQQQKTVAMATQCSIKQEYTSGYTEAARESLAYLHSVHSVFKSDNSAINNNLNRNLNNVRVPEISSLLANRLCVPTLEQTYHMEFKSETGGHIYNKDTNGNFADDNFTFSDVHDAVGTNFIQNTNSVSLADDILSSTATFQYPENVNSFPELVRDINGNVDRTDDELYGIRNVPNAREHDVSISSVADDNETDSDTEDRLFIHVDNSVEGGRNDDLGNMDQRGREVDEEQREEVWRPW